MYVVKAAEMMFVQKMCMFNIDEIDTSHINAINGNMRSYGNANRQVTHIKNSS